MQSPPAHSSSDSAPAAPDWRAIFFEAAPSRPVRPSNPHGDHRTFKEPCQVKSKTPAIRLAIAGTSVRHVGTDINHPLLQFRIEL